MKVKFNSLPKELNPTFSLFGQQRMHKTIQLLVVLQALDKNGTVVAAYVQIDIAFIIAVNC